MMFYKIFKLFCHILRQILLIHSFKKGESTCKSGNKSLFFATPNNMLLLSQIAHWYCDGTFDVAPKLLKQLFTLNVILKG